MCLNLVEIPPFSVSVKLVNNFFFPQGIEIKPAIGEFWSVKGVQNSFVVIAQLNPFEVQYFKTSVKGQLISEAIFLGFKFLKKQTNFCPKMD